MVPSADFWTSRAGPSTLRALPCAFLTPRLWPLCFVGPQLLRAPLPACRQQAGPSAGLLALSHAVQGTFLCGLMSKHVRALA